MAESIFQKIARGDTDTEILFQDDRCFVIRDLMPFEYKQKRAHRA